MAAPTPSRTASRSSSTSTIINLERATRPGYSLTELPTSAASIDLGSAGINLHSGHVFSVAMNYDGAVLSVTITDTVTHVSATQSYAVDIAGIIGGPTAYVGFTASTGGSTATQKILNWTYAAAPTS